MRVDRDAASRSQARNAFRAAKPAAAPPPNDPVASSEAALQPHLSYSS